MVKRRLDDIDREIMELIDKQEELYFAYLDDPSESIEQQQADIELLLESKRKEAKMYREIAMAYINSIEGCLEREILECRYIFQLDWEGVASAVVENVKRSLTKDMVQEIYKHIIEKNGNVIEMLRMYVEDSELAVRSEPTEEHVEKKKLEPFKWE